MVDCLKKQTGACVARPLYAAEANSIPFPQILCSFGGGRGGEEIIWQYKIMQIRGSMQKHVCAVEGSNATNSKVWLNRFLFKNINQTNMRMYASERSPHDPRMNLSGSKMSEFYTDFRHFWGNYLTQEQRRTDQVVYNKIATIVKKKIDQLV